MMMGAWLSANMIELFGAVAGIAYVILEIRRNILLWPLGIITSVVYIWVFGHNGLYANMGLQGYYLVISIYGWHKWHLAGSREQGARSMGQGAWSRGQEESDLKTAGLQECKTGNGESQSDVRRIDGRTAAGCLAVALAIWGLLWFVLGRWTDSPVPLWDGLIASLSVVATWMLTRKYLEQWYVWIGANAIALVVYLTMGMYPTAVLFFVYFVMAIIGVIAWSRQGAKRQAFRPQDCKTEPRLRGDRPSDGAKRQTFRPSDS